MRCERCPYASSFEGKRGKWLWWGEHLEPSRRCTLAQLDTGHGKPTANANYSRKISDVKFCHVWRLSEKELAS